MATANALITRIEEVTMAGKSYKNSSMYKNRKDEIERNFLPTYEEVCQKFSAVSSSFRALSLVCTISVDFESLKNTIGQLRRGVAQDNYDKGLLISLKRDLDKVDVELVRVWRSHISSRTSSIAGVLETLDKVIADRPEKKILDSKKAIFWSDRPGSRAAIQAIDEYVSTYNRLIDDLNLKETVLNFLKRLASGRGTTLDHMNQEVFDWLRNSGFAGKLSLVIGE